MSAEREPHHEIASLRSPPLVARVALIALGAAAWAVAGAQVDVLLVSLAAVAVLAWACAPGLTLTRTELRVRTPLQGLLGLRGRSIPLDALTHVEQADGALQVIDREGRRYEVWREPGLGPFVAQLEAAIGASVRRRPSVAPRPAEPEALLCPFCREALGDQLKSACLTCDTWHHAECYAEHGRCAVTGCAAGARVAA